MDNNLGSHTERDRGVPKWVLENDDVAKATSDQMVIAKSGNRTNSTGWHLGERR